MAASGFGRAVHQLCGIPFTLFQKNVHYRTMMFYRDLHHYGAGMAPADTMNDFYFGTTGGAGDVGDTRRRRIRTWLRNRN